MIYFYRVIQATVIDGDTIDAVIDLGFRITHTIRLRLHGIDCPEMRTIEGKAAKQFALNWIGTRALTVQTFKDATEKYGRYLARVLASDGDLNTALVEAGHAVYKDYK